MTFTVLLIACASTYILAALGALLILLRKPGTSYPAPEATGEGETEPFLSVLVAARNEEDTLPRCLDALRNQDYPPNRIEFIVANDHSIDATARIVLSVSREDPRFHLIQVPDPVGSLRGKAHALHQAILQARSNILLTTDADCAPPPGWARAMAGRFSDPALGMVCGITTVEHETILDRIQALDWLLLLAVASAASSAGFPLTAMGNNMAFRREAYLAVGGYPALPFSVTEDYALFQAIHRTSRWRVELVLDRALRNDTLPLASFREVFSQRKRWARGGLRASPWAYGLYLTVFLAHLFLLLGLFLQPVWAVPLLLAKCGADLALIAVAKHRLGVRGLRFTFPLFEAYLFSYVIAMPFAILIAPGTRWKERTF